MVVVGAADLGFAFAPSHTPFLLYLLLPPPAVLQGAGRHGGRVRPGADLQHGERAGGGPANHLPVGPLDLGRPEWRDQH